MAVVHFTNRSKVLEDLQRVEASSRDGALARCARGRIPSSEMIGARSQKMPRISPAWGTDPPWQGDLGPPASRDGID